MSDQQIILNGINGATGEYFTEPFTESEAVAFATGVAPAEDHQKTLQNLARQAGTSHLGLPFERHPEKVKEAGWCVVFHVDEEDAVREAIQPLVQHRTKQIGDASIVKQLDYATGETVQTWLARQRVTAGTVSVRKVPLYVLLIGAPDKIPFEFGHLLDVEYCVGRLHFDTPDGYAQYVNSVIAYETGPTVSNRRSVAFWGPHHRNDGATQVSSEFLVKPLALGQPDEDKLMDRIAVATGKPFQTTYLAPEESTKAALSSILRPDDGGACPALLFTGSHGLGWPLDHPLQTSAGGALLCQDFPGRGRGPLQPDHYFSAIDVPGDARVHGLVAFHFACFGAGTPQKDRFTHKPGTEPDEIARTPFISALPKALLSHPNGGALAVIGHVDRAWTSSFTTTAAGLQLLPFENALALILTGLPVGYAMKDFNERYASLSAGLTGLLEKRGFGMPVSDTELVSKWTERNDSESYTVLGDPAVQIRVNDLV